jgi:hypothetical protein
MKVNGITREQAEQIAKGMGITLYTKVSNKDQSGFMLRPATEEYRAIGRGGRRKWAVTWEGHKVFMEKVFDLNPKAVISSCKATYNGLEDFRQKYRDTQYGNYAL